MREQGPSDPAMRHLTVVLDNPTCTGPFACDSLLPAVLPMDYTLTVYGYSKKYTGGNPPWRR